ncbi:MAG: WecB/TagA/CpsF family glycosyltransferase [Candidatus Melainabacteria bacterium]
MSTATRQSQSQPTPSPQGLNPYPPSFPIDGIPVAAFDSQESLFERFCLEAEKPGQSFITSLNIHNANEAVANPEVFAAIHSADVVYCDGAGVLLGARLLGTPMQVARLTAADWFLDMLVYLSLRGKTVYLLGNAPGVTHKTVALLTERMASQPVAHSVVGHHHGFIVNEPALEARVIEQINSLNPDVLVVGMGTPLQELWVARNRHRIQAGVLFTLGATMDFITGKVPRCPEWMGKMGCEWLYRLGYEPKRMFNRYVVGNPQFLVRQALARFQRG